jgi:hypothetical protein
MKVHFKSTDKSFPATKTPRHEDFTKGLLMAMVLTFKSL